MIDLARKVKEVRDAQRNYFKIRTPKGLDYCKRLERDLDDIVNQIIGEAAFVAGGQEWADWNATMLNFGE